MKKLILVVAPIVAAGVATLIGVDSASAAEAGRFGRFVVSGGRF